jgi:adenylate kinase
MEFPMAIYVLLGPPGVGKGTLAELLCEQYGFMHVSTGDILREEVRRGSALGLQVKGLMSSGGLVPDDIIGAIIAGRLREDEVRRRGCLLDGFPRTLAQAELFDRLIAQGAPALDRVLLLHAEEALLLQRLTARRVCSRCRAVFNVLFTPPRQAGVCDQCGGALEQRSDDTEATARERLRVYLQQTEPLIRFYETRGLVLRLDASRHKLEVRRDVCQALKLA